MSSLRRITLAMALMLAGGFCPIGCGSSEREPAETIQGKEPADYREQMEGAIAQPGAGAPSETP